MRDRTWHTICAILLIAVTGLFLFLFVAFVIHASMQGIGVPNKTIWESGDRQIYSGPSAQAIDKFYFVRVVEHVVVSRPTPYVEDPFFSLHLAHLSSRYRIVDIAERLPFRREFCRILGSGIEILEVKVVGQPISKYVRMAIESHIFGGSIPAIRERYAEDQGLCFVGDLINWRVVYGVNSGSRINKSPLDIFQSRCCGLSFIVSGSRGTLSSSRLLVNFAIGIVHRLPLTARIEDSSSYQKYRYSRDDYRQPVTQDVDMKWRGPICACGIGLALSFSVIGFWLIQAAGPIEDVSVANLSKVAVGLFFIGLSLLTVQAALDILDLGRVYV
jgi:hypothetical protein